MTNKEIRKKLEELSDEKYKKFHSSLCPNVDSILGVRVPVLRNFAKELAKDNWKEYLENAQYNSYEEILLQGMVIGLSKMKVEELKYYLDKFIPKIDNWATCDITVAGLKLTKRYKEEMWEYINKYLESSKEFELRFAIVMMLDFYIIDGYIDKVLKLLDNVKHEGYYVKMAVAWAISICYIKYPEKTFKLFENNKLDDFTYNKALQKIIESCRINDKTKDKIRKMKR